MYKIEFQNNLAVIPRDLWNGREIEEERCPHRASLRLWDFLKPTMAMLQDVEKAGIRTPSWHPYGVKEAYQEEKMGEIAHHFMDNVPADSAAGGYILLAVRQVGSCSFWEVISEKGFEIRARISGSVERLSMLEWEEF